MGGKDDESVASLRGGFVGVGNRKRKRIAKRN